MKSCRSCLLALALVSLAACAGERPGEVTTDSTGIEIDFADVLAPSVLELEGRAVVAGEDEAEGLWAVVPGLPRPERGRLQSPETGRAVIVPLFRGRELRISREAAEALGLESGSAPVSIVAVRSQVRLVEGGRR